jgi:hypothetical protein
VKFILVTTVLGVILVFAAILQSAQRSSRSNVAFRVLMLAGATAMFCGALGWYVLLNRH